VVYFGRNKMRKAFSPNGLGIVLALISLFASLVLADGHGNVAIGILAVACLYVVLAIWVRETPNKRQRGTVSWRVLGTLGLIVVSGFVGRYIWNTAAESELKKPIGALQPDNVQDDPSSYCHGSNLPVKGMRLYVGQTLAFTTQFPQAIVRATDKYGPHDLLVIDRDKTGGIIVKHLDVFDQDGKFVVGIEDNLLNLNPLNNSGFTKTRSRMIVRDQSNQEVLNIWYMNKSAIKILGILRYRKLGPAIFTDDQTIMGIGFSGKNCYHGDMAGGAALGI
jgi:hypothetical protein